MMEFVGWDDFSIPNFSWKVNPKKIMVPVTTNQVFESHLTILHHHFTTHGQAAGKVPRDQANLTWLVENPT